jgi:cation:H+ antiporter
MTFLFLTGQFLAGFVLLVAGAEFLVRGASRIAAKLRIPAAVIGLTVVAFGTSLPELVVSLTASLSGEGNDIAIGNIVGSNIANLGLILGLCGLIATLAVKASFTRREIPLLIGVSVIFTFMAMFDGSIGRIDGLILVAGLIVFEVFSFRAATREREFGEELAGTVEAAENIDDRIATPSQQPWFDVLLILVGIVGLVVGADWLVDAATEIARVLNVPELIIGLTLVAVGTSLPEVATSLVAVVRKNGDIAIANVLGSNLFNILGIAGITAVVSPIAVPSSMIVSSFLPMLGFTVLVALLAWPKPNDIKRWEAGLLLTLYLAYTIWLVFFSAG